MYATRTDFETALGADAVALILDRDRDADPDGTSIDQALVNASAEINGYVGARYDLPLAGPVPILRQTCIDIATYRLANSYALLTEDIRLRFEDAIRQLTSISKGLIALPVDKDQDGVGENTSVRVKTGGPERVFGRDSLEGF